MKCGAFFHIWPIVIDEKKREERVRYEEDQSTRPRHQKQSQNTELSANWHLCTVRLAERDQGAVDQRVSHVADH